MCGLTNQDKKRLLPKVAANGQVPTWNAALSKWEAATPSGGGAGYATLAGNNVFAGNNTFNGINLFSNTNYYYQMPTFSDGVNLYPFVNSNDLAVSVAALVASAPSTLDTLNELAASLGNDANFSTTVMALIGTKASTASLASYAQLGAANTFTQNQIIAKANSTAITDLFINPTVKTSGDLFNLGINNSARFRVDYSGGVIASNTVQAPDFALMGGQTAISTSSGYVLLTNNYSGTFTGGLRLGGTSNAHPMIKRNGAAIDFRLADDSAYAAINTGATTINGNININGSIICSSNQEIGSTNYFAFASRTMIRSSLDGILKLSNYAETDFNRLQLGGTTNAFPSIKRNGTAIDFRLADDSAYANIGAGIVVSLSGVQSYGTIEAYNTTTAISVSGPIKWGATNAFPMLKRNGAAIDFRLADDSNYAPINSGKFTVNPLTGTIAGEFVGGANGTYISFSAASNFGDFGSESIVCGSGSASNFAVLARAGRTLILGSNGQRTITLETTGVVTLLSSITTTQVNVGGTGAGRPMFINSGVNMQVRTGDNLGFTYLQGKLMVDNVWTAEASPVINGYITMYDSTGASKKVATLA